MSRGGLGELRGVVGVWCVVCGVIVEFAGRVSKEVDVVESGKRRLAVVAVAAD